MDNNELKHYGVPGMKWGIRRSSGQIATARRDNFSKKAQNIATISRHTSEAFREGSTIANSASRSNRISKKTKNELSKMSDQELKAKINRMNMEQQYANLNPSKVSRGAAHVSNILSVAGSVAAIGSSIAGMAYVISQMKR